MDNLEPGTFPGAQSDVTAADINVEVGTSPKEFKVWTDYIFDRLHATPSRVLLTSATAALFGLVVFVVGLTIAIGAGFAPQYLVTPGVYVACFGLAYCAWFLRWASQEIHTRNRALRPCFDVDAQRFRSVLVKYMTIATENKRVLVPAALFTLLVWGYFAAVLFGPMTLSSALLVGFPSAGFASIWRTGDALVAKYCILCLFTATAIFECYTAARFTFWAAMAYHALADLPAEPLPHLATELLRGVVGISLTGTWVWSVGVILGELLYGTRLDALGGLFLIWVIAFGVVAYFLPHRAVRTIVLKAKDAAIARTIEAMRLRPSSHQSAKELREIDEFVRSITREASGRLTVYQIAGLVASQAAALIPAIYNTFIAANIHQIFSIR